MLAVVSSCVTSPFLRTMRCSGFAGSIPVSIHGPMLPLDVEILALGDVELAVAQPIADRAFVAQSKAGNHPERVFLRHVLALAADHHGDLALVVELFGDFRPNQLLPVPDQRIRRAIEHARIFRVFGQRVIGAAFGVVDADSTGFFPAPRAAAAARPRRAGCRDARRSRPPRLRRARRRETLRAGWRNG